jgi:molybdate transport system regulatory protein
VKPKLRIWVVFANGFKLGDGRARLLELIDERGSLRQAAAELDMSYRNAWGYLRQLEAAAGFKLVERSPDGTLRSGMRLTASGREFLACYRTFQRSLDQAAARQFARAFRGKTFGRRSASTRGADGRPTTPRPAAARSRRRSGDAG